MSPKWLAPSPDSTIALTSEYGTPYAQPLANLAWEDSIYITRDGLSLYAFYEPADTFSYVLGQQPIDHLYQYERGTLIGQDFSNPISGETTPWIHADVAIAQRASTADPFTCWALTAIAGNYDNRGAPMGVLDPSDPSKLRNTPLALAGVPTALQIDTRLSAHIIGEGRMDDTTTVRRGGSTSPA